MTVWRLMLVRPYQPLFASLYGNQCSKEYDSPFLMIFLEGWAYWYIPEEVHSKHDEVFLKRFSGIEQCREYYENAHTEVRERFEHVIRLIKHLSQGNSGMGKPCQELGQVLSEVFESYGRILSFPEMAIGPYAKERLADNVARLLYGVDDTTALTPAQKIARDWVVPYLTYSDAKSQSPEGQFEIRVRDSAAMLRDSLTPSYFRHVVHNKIMQAAKEIPLPYYGTSKEIKERVEKRIEEKLASMLKESANLWEEPCEDEARRLASEFAYLGCGWRLGASLESGTVRNRIEGVLKRCLMEGKYLLPELEVATLEKYHEVMLNNKEKTVERLRDCAAQSAVSYDQLCGFYAIVISHDASTRLRRKHMAYRINHALGTVVEHLTGSSGVPAHRLLCNLMHDELVTLIRTGTHSADLEARNTGCVICFENGHASLRATGRQKTLEFVKELCSADQIDIFPPLQTVPLSPPSGEPIGINKPILGRAFILDNEQDLLDVSENDILVARFVEPYHGLMFRTPKAIIVEDPNVASHAVHVAQTKGVPILVGARGVVEYCRRHISLGVPDARPILEISTQGQVTASRQAQPCVL